MSRTMGSVVSCIIILWSYAFGIAYQQPRQMSVKDAVNYALEHNPRINSARAVIDIEAARKRQLWSPSKPSFNVEYEGMPNGTYFDLYESKKLIINQNIEFPLLYFKRIQQQSFLVERARQELELERINLTAEVKTAYINAAYAREKYQFAVRNLNISDELLLKIKNRFGAGEEGKKDYLWAKLQRDRADNGVSATQEEYNNTMENLKLLLAGKDLSPQYTLELSDSLVYIPIDSSLFSNLEAILAHHPAIKIHQNTINAANKAVTISNQLILPDISINLYKQNLNNKSGFWGLEAGLTLPVWFWSDQRGKKAEAQAGLRSAEWQQTLEISKIRADYQSAKVSFQGAEQRVKRLYTEILSNAQELFSLTEVQYREGEVGYIDVMLAQQSLIETKFEYITALADYNKALIRLEQVLGKELR